MSKPVVISAVIPGRSSLSESISLEGVTYVVGLIMPSAWTPANVTIQGSPFGVNFFNLHDGVPGTELVFNVVPGTIVAVNPNRLRCCAAVKLRSGTAAAPVIQAVSRTFGIVVEGDVEQVYPTPFDELLPDQSA